LDTTRGMETPEVVAISTPDLHPLELYSVHTSLSFLCISGSLVESLSSRSLCSFVPAAPSFPHFFIFPWTIPVLLCKSWKPVYSLSFAVHQDALLTSLLLCHLALELGCSITTCGYVITICNHHNILRRPLSNSARGRHLLWVRKSGGPMRPSAGRTWSSRCPRHSICIPTISTFPKHVFEQHLCS
jgi:hypothetical protein